MVTASTVPMARKAEVYTIRTTPQGWLITKFDEDTEVLTFYTLQQRRNWVRCECWAATKHTCRHREMLRLFQEAGRIDKGWLYNWTTQEWIRPLTEPNRRRK